MVGLEDSVLILIARLFKADNHTFAGLASTIRLTTRLAGARRVLLAKLSFLESTAFTLIETYACDGVC